MQISQLVSVRRGRWRVVDVRTFDQCRLVTLVGVTPPHVGDERRVLMPFDDVDPVDTVRRPRMARSASWRPAFREVVADDTPPGCLRSVRHARVDAMAHQLEPALAIVRGLGSRVLLADEVGLGKTIQAGIVISELLARRFVERALVLTPASLRDQWARELTTRFALDVSVADAATLRKRVSILPIGVNPWIAERIAVASLDYVKRAEVLPAVMACPWDIVVLDEAHGAAGDSDRQSAVRSLASRAGYVLLLTATPHSGDHQAFASLCGFGAAGGDPLLVFRRTRADVRGGTKRRVHALHVRPNDDELRMHALLTRYTSAIRAEHPHAWLAMAVLHKRALSSAWALEQSLERRLDALSRRDGNSDVEQLTLPLWDVDGELNPADRAPVWPVGVALADRAREGRMVRALLAIARSASTRETKLRALDRLLRRSQERALVFTEYRDTLVHMQATLGQPAALLHGGLTRSERLAALADFSSGRCRILLATDAAGEGLNLQDGCRLVINLELPWNPMRLEQRIGRVDRIGQARMVHAVHLIGARTGETRILARLRARIAKARSEIGAPDPIGADEELAVANLVLGAHSARSVTLVPGKGDEPPEVKAQLPGPAEAGHYGRFSGPAEAGHYGGFNGPHGRVSPDLRATAIAEVQRIVFARALVRLGRGRGSPRLGAEGPWIARVPRHARLALGRRVVMLWRVGCDNTHGRSVESTLVPISIHLGRLPPVRDRAWVEDLVGQVDREARTVLDRATAGWRADAARAVHEFVAARIARERAILATSTGALKTFQPGLFDRRSEHARLSAAAAKAASDVDRAGRLAAIERDAGIASESAELLLVLIP
jgi:superfamily II DNA or RNA helicase